MSRSKLLAFAIGFSLCTFSQNDLDAIRYARGGVGGSSRFIAMGGAFGAVGADLGCAGYNPAGLGLFRKGEMNFTGSLRLSNNTASIYNKSTSSSNVKFAFNNFGIAYAWPATADPESRHVIAFNNSQIQNFSGTTTMSGNTNNSSILKDMRNLAVLDGTPDNLNPGYEGLGYDTYLLDYDPNTNQYISLVDPKRTIAQSREIVTSGRMNELNFSYAYSLKDKIYFGASIGVPRVDYTSTTSHFESDVKDSMRLGFTSPSTYTSTYIDGLSSLDTAYKLLQGFHDLTYTEYFKTQGSGVNLKLGAIARLNESVRVGVYFHTPTIYYLNDTYYNSISATFDGEPNSPVESKYPENGGYFEYRVITPSRVSVNSAFLIKKMAVIGLDYEYVNYPGTQLLSDQASVFADVNAAIKSKYKGGHNVRLGGELNIKPIMLRAGYAMMGSPFGDVFGGKFVRNTFSLGIGFRTKDNWYADLFWAKTISTEDYYLFTTFDTKAKIAYSASSIGATVGIKF